MKLLRIWSLSMLALWFPLSHSAQADTDQIEREVMQVLDDFMAGFSASDAVAHTATYHFPHYRLARGGMTSIETRAEAIEINDRGFANLPGTGWHRSVWRTRDIISISESKVHVATSFSRLREDGSEIVTTESLYILIKQDGRWGIKMRSSYL